MNRRMTNPALLLSVLALGPGLAGCETLRGGSHAPADAPVETDSQKVLDVTSDNPEKPRPFFKSTRLPGAMSDEGRDIESNLGIH